MTKAPAEMMREFVRSQKFTSTEDIMTAMKDMFKDVLQEVMVCELVDELGYKKNEGSRKMIVITSRKITATATQKRLSKLSSVSLM